MLALYFLFHVFKQRAHEIDLKEGINLIIEKPGLVILALALMPINWIIEIYKWKFAIQKIQGISWSQAMKSVLAGMLLNLFTPNRIGELGGRLLYIEKENRTDALYVNTLCGIAQLLITSLIGLLALFNSYPILRRFWDISYPLFSAISLGLGLLLIFLFFKSKLLLTILTYFRNKQHRKRPALQVGFYMRLHLFSYSLLRYIIFSFQFYLLVKIFEPELNFWLSSSLMALLFLGTTWVPSGWLSDLPIRGSMGFLLFDAFGYSGFSGLFVAVYLWLINLFIPSVFSVLVLPTINKMLASKLKRLWS